MRTRSSATPITPPAVVDSGNEKKETIMYLSASEAFTIMAVLGTVVLLFALASHHVLEMKRLSSGYYKHINQRSDTTPPSAPCPRDSSPDISTPKASRRSTGSGPGGRSSFVRGVQVS